MPLSAGIRIGKKKLIKDLIKLLYSMYTLIKVYFSKIFILRCKREQGDPGLHVGRDGANTRGLLVEDEGPKQAVAAGTGMVYELDVQAISALGIDPQWDDPIHAKV